MQSHATIDEDVIERSVDQRVILRNIDWSDYERLLEARGENASPRMTFLEGTLELMTPSLDHEILKTKLARLLEAYAEELGIDLEGYGSWTLRKKTRKGGLEPDECYSIGPNAKLPELAIEVAWTSGGLDKLEIYRRLGVREVWIWKDNRLHAFALRGDRYEPIPSSELLPQVDFDLLRSMLDLPSQTAAVRELRVRLRSRT